MDRGPLRLGTVAAIAATAFSAAGCGSSTPPAPMVGPWTNDTQGRLDFGCAFLRGSQTDDASTRHFAGLIGRELFTSALEIRAGDRLAAQLWNATDRVVDTGVERGNGAAEHRRTAVAGVLALCAGSGLSGSASRDDLDRYACLLNDDLARQRPHITSFGPEMTSDRAGDPFRMDAEIVSSAQFLHALETRAPLPPHSAAQALRDADDAAYTEALQMGNDLC